MTDNNEVNRELVITNPENPLSKAIYQNPMISVASSMLVVATSSIMGRVVIKLYIAPRNEMLEKNLAYMFGGVMGFVTGFFIGNDALPIGQGTTPGYDDNPIKMNIGDDNWGKVYPYSSPLIFGFLYMLIGSELSKINPPKILISFVDNAVLSVADSFSRVLLKGLETIYSQTEGALLRVIETIYPRTESAELGVIETIYPRTESAELGGTGIFGNSPTDHV